MRPDREYQPAVDFKQSMVAPLRAAGLDLRIAFEDDRRNVAMFREPACRASTSTPGIRVTDARRPRPA
jgi:hypothetical protein